VPDGRQRDVHDGDVEDDHELREAAEEENPTSLHRQPTLVVGRVVGVAFLVMADAPYPGSVHGPPQRSSRWGGETHSLAVRHRCAGAGGDAEAAWACRHRGVGRPSDCCANICSCMEWRSERRCSLERQAERTTRRSLVHSAYLAPRCAACAAVQRPCGPSVLAAGGGAGKRSCRRTPTPRFSVSISATAASAVWRERSAFASRSTRSIPSSSPRVGRPSHGSFPSTGSPRIERTAVIRRSSPRTRGTCRACSRSTGRARSTIGSSHWRAGSATSVSGSPSRSCAELFRSDGCCFINRTGPYAYESYAFKNSSEDIIGICSWACEAAGLEHRRTLGQIRINRRASVAQMLEHVGRKA